MQSAQFHLFFSSEEKLNDFSLSYEILEGGLFWTTKSLCESKAATFIQMSTIEMCFWSKRAVFFCWVFDFTDLFATDGCSQWELRRMISANTTTVRAPTATVVADTRQTQQIVYLHISLADWLLSGIGQNREKGPHHIAVVDANNRTHDMRMLPFWFHVWFIFDSHLRKFFSFLLIRTSVDRDKRTIKAEAKYIALFAQFAICTNDSRVSDARYCGRWRCTHHFKRHYSLSLFRRS